MMSHWYKQSVLIVLLFIGSATSYGQAFNQSPEQQLINALTSIQSQQLEQAISQLQQLLKSKPDFKLAQLIYADVLLAKAQGLEKVGQLLKQNVLLEGFLAEASKRWQNHKSPVRDGLLPAALLNLDQRYQYAVVVGLNNSRLYLFENKNGIPKKIGDFYVSMGKSGPYKQFEGDNRTPLGVYFIENFLSPESLPDKYGEGAFPLNYPNVWDDRLGKTGYGIWLHGTPLDTYSRPPRDSEGCVVLSNADLQTVGSYLQLKRTPFVIADNINWLDKEKWQQEKEFFTKLVTGWLQDWQSMDTTRYIQHYSKTFKAGKTDFSQWYSHKQQVNKNKKYIRVKADDLSILKHPKDDILVVTFQQHYKSNNYSSVGYKRQYWKQESDGQWRIIFEGRIQEPDQVLTRL
ncbi:MAG: L,D-transpeptidase family protein [Gammaproteobacteria bacterium]|nr:L,D-transpeptidase family protein [Gammaproteobacteria bacterium]